MKARIFLLSVAALASALQAAPLKQNSAKAAKKQEDTRITDAKERVRQTLSDPDSANFREIFLTEAGTVCGELNAKNKMGGYAGFRRFIVAGDKIRTEDVPGTVFDYRWLELCEEPAKI